MEILDFYADWCGPCQMMEPVMAEFEKAHPEVKVTAVNIDEEEELAEKYEVSSIPCIVFIKDNKEVERVVGVASPKKLEKILEKFNA
ncbi:thioredoxin [Candidatus Saccharibacteria bacterium]|nr:thioredoxin [Candidatus Saccharibacteria bacterium]